MQPIMQPEEYGSLNHMRQLRTVYINCGNVNDRYDVSNYQSTECLFNSLFKLTTKEHQTSALLALCDGNPPVTGGSQHRGPVTRKMFPFDDVIMINNYKTNQKKPSKSTCIFHQSVVYDYLCFHPSVVLFPHRQLKTNINMVILPKETK